MKACHGGTMSSQHTEPRKALIIGENHAVMKVGNFTLNGFFAWIACLLIHILFLIGSATSSPSFSAGRMPTSTAIRKRGSSSIRPATWCRRKGRGACRHSSTLMRVISTCDAPGITISALSLAIAASMQQNFR